MVLFKTLALVFALYSSVTCAPAGPVPVLLEGKLLHSIMTNDHQLVTFTEDVLPTGIDYRTLNALEKVTFINR